MNRALRKLTLINVVFLPQNLIAGIAGMSELSMMTSSVSWWVSLPVLLTCMGLLGAVMGVALRRMA
ncbi:hypothetical protein DCO48_13435 [Pseudomonas sp. SDI]|nr:hypothetical protein DCO48_13435 [Pseudomonas sp. SDI]